MALNVTIRSNPLGVSTRSTVVNPKTIGPQGPQGFQGPQGLKGSTGADSVVQGPQGFQGDVGPQGFQGNTGAQGAQGFQGNVGPQGFQGFQGDVGPQGFQGNVGPQGFQGNVGPQGFQGNTGAQGFQGFQGDVGPQGFQGATGSDSTVQGPQGPQGNDGSAGQNGTNVITLTMGDGINLIQTGSIAYTPPLPYATTIQSWTISEATPNPISTTTVIDVRKSTVGTYPTASSIAASAKPTLTAQKISSDATLTGWSKSLVIGDILQFVVESNSAAKKIILAIKTEK
jgi:hypothetical protein